jgi:hypothetical protein
MAITIEQQPQAITSVYNPIITTCSSTNVAEPKFNFIFEIYDNANTTLLRTLRIPPEINYSYGVVDVSRVIEDYIGTDFFKNLTGVNYRECENSDFGFNIRIGEEYEVAGVITQFLNLTSINKRSFNASLTYSNFIDFDYTDFELDGITKRFLTNINTRTVDRTDEGFMHFNNNNEHTNFKIQTYFSDGSIDQTATITNGSFSDSVFAMFPCNPVSLNAATLATGSQPLIDTDIASYVIFAEDGGAVVSQNYTFNVVDYCTPYTLHFLNDLGGFDSFPFQVAKDSWTFEKEYYKQDPLRIQSDGTYVFSELDREVVQNYTNQKKKTRLISNWITSTESEWLRELFSSPEIYLQNGSTFTSVLLKVTDYQVKYEEFDELFNIEVEIEYSVDSYRQRY